MFTSFIVVMFTFVTLCFVVINMYTNCFHYEESEHQMIVTLWTYNRSIFIPPQCLVREIIHTCEYIWSQYKEYRDIIRKMAYNDVSRRILRLLLKTTSRGIALELINDRLYLVKKPKILPNVFFFLFHLKFTGIHGRILSLDSRLSFSRTIVKKERERERQTERKGDKRQS